MTTLSYIIPFVVILGLTTLLRFEAIKKEGIEFLKIVGEQRLKAR